MKRYHYTIRENKRLKRYTIRKYDDQHCVAKWRVYPLLFREGIYHTQNEIMECLYYKSNLEVERIK